MHIIYCFIKVRKLVFLLGSLSRKNWPLSLKLYLCCVLIEFLSFFNIIIKILLLCYSTVAEHKLVVFMVERVQSV